MRKAPCFHPRVFAVRFFKYWFPVIFWMILIFSASTNLGASQNTSRIIGPFLRWLNPEITDEAVGAIQFVIRKISHAVEYGILALLLWRARRNISTDRACVEDQSQRVESVATGGQPSRVPRGWNWHHAQFAILLSVIYAATDEFHQYFVSTRQGSIWDVLLDTSGALAGIFALWIIGRWFKRW